MSALLVGATGRHRGVAFVLRGKLTLRHTSGATWDEFYAWFDDGRRGWVAVAGRQAFVTFEAEPFVPAFDDLRSARPVWPRYTVLEKGRARYHAASGKLPFRPPMGQSYAYADLVAPDGAFATIDYSEDPPRLFVGERLAAQKLHLRNPDQTTRRRNRPQGGT